MVFYFKIDVIFSMRNLTNFVDIFVEAHYRYFGKYKSINVRKYNIENICEELIKFVYNCTYWSRIYLDPITNTYNKSHISGKYLNEIHLSFIRDGFYVFIYKEILTDYLKRTNYETLKTISIDSTFIRNIGGIGCHRNPYYNNKPGFKLHALVDSLGIPISFVTSSCNVNDSLVIEKLFENLLVDNDIFKKYSDTFLADSAYSGLINIYYLTTEKGLNIVMGRNKRHIPKDVTINDGQDSQVKGYKMRCIVENFFSHIQRYPCLINNYEKNPESYMGLVYLVSSIILINRMNNITDELNNDNLKERKNAELVRKRICNEKRKKRDTNNRKKIEDDKKEEYKKRKIKTTNITNKIKDLIWTNINKNVIDSIYKKNIHYTHLRLKKNTKIKHDDYVKTKCFDLLKNEILTETIRYKFGKKERYIVTAKAAAFSAEYIYSAMLKININKKVEAFSNDFIRLYK